MEIKEILEKQKSYFNAGKTLPVSARKKALGNLKRSIRQMEYEIFEALTADLGKSSFEGYMTEVGLALEEISYMEKHLAAFCREKRVRTPLAQFWSRSYTKPSPYGTVLIMSPWNYPFLLTIGPLIDALAAGNTAVLKPSNDSPATSAVIKTLIQKTFPAGLVYMVEGGRAVNTELLDAKFDYIFFTGGKKVGRLVMEKASKHLTPVSLELGGKSPCIVDDSANLKIAARRIVFGKFLNAGQTCVAPDYLLVHSKVKEPLLDQIREEIKRQLGERPLDNGNYGKIINEKHFERIKGLMQGEEAFIGGTWDENRRIAPTVLTGVTMDSPVMQEEIFGPVLPVLEFDHFERVMEVIGQNPTPLAFYLFTGRKSVKKMLLEKVQFGGCCVNDTIIHLATSQMGFGGVGESGMGSYHGKAGFDTFTHHKGIVDKKTGIDLPWRYQPYTVAKEKVIRMFLR